MILNFNKIKIKKIPLNFKISLLSMCRVIIKLIPHLLNNIIDKKFSSFDRGHQNLFKSIKIF